jgi:hypothetical protein
MIKVIKEMLPWGVVGAMIPITFLTIFFAVLFLLS